SFSPRTITYPITVCNKNSSWSKLSISFTPVTSISLRFLIFMSCVPVAISFSTFHVSFLPLTSYSYHMFGGTGLERIILQILLSLHEQLHTMLLPRLFSHVLSHVALLLLKLFAQSIL